MILKTKNMIVASMMALFFLTGSLPVFAEEKVPVEKILPKKVFAYFTVHNVKEAAKRWENTGVSKWVHSQEMADFRSSFVENMIEALKSEEEDKGITLNELVDTFQGEVTLSVFQPPRSALAAALVADVGENRNAITTIIEKIKEKSKDDGTLSVETIEGVEVDVWTPNDLDEDMKRFLGEAKVCFFIKDNRMVITTSEKAVISILERWDGQNKRTFASNKNFVKVKELCSEGEERRAPVLTQYYDIIGAVRFAASRAGTAEAGMMVGMLPTLGLDQLKAIGSVTDLGTEKYDMVSTTCYLVEQPTRGFMKVFSATPDDQNAPSYVSGKSNMYQSMNWDVELAYTTVESLVDVFLGPGSTAKFLDQAEGEIGFHPKKDFLDNLAGKFCMDGELADLKKVEEGVLPYRFGIEIKDPKKANEFLSQIAEMDGVELEERNFQGTTIYESDSEPSVGFAVVGKHVIISTSTALVESVIRGNKEGTLAGTEEYKKVAKHCPDKTCVRSFAGKSANFGLLKSFYDDIREGDMEFDDIDNLPLRKAMENTDFTKLPAFEVFMKYMGASGGYLIPTESGILQKQFVLKAE